jgi:hypothetical protein
MTEINYQEQIFKTTNTKLAATMLTFGASLHAKVPLEWHDVWLTRDDYLKYRNDSRHNRYPPKTKVSFNFVVVDIKACQQIVAAYEDENASDALSTALAEQGLSEDQKQSILAAHSKVLARACRETLENREFLIKLIKIFPEDAKWDLIYGEGSGQHVQIGKNSSDQLRVEYLNQL